MEITEMTLKNLNHRLYGFFKSNRLALSLIVGVALYLITVSLVDASTKIPTLEVNLKDTDSPESMIPAIKIVAILTILSVAPAILLMMTSFTRILVVLSFTRQALGTQTMPPNQVILGLSLFLTMFTMSPLWKVIDQNALTPYIEKKIGQEQAITELMKPVRKFMVAETRKSDLKMLYSLTNEPRPATPNDIPLSILMPSFMISELKTAFQMGFMVYLPFLIIDMVISSVLMAMGMMMLPPTVVSLPFKLVLFVLADGWSMIVNSLVRSFHIF